MIFLKIIRDASEKVSKWLWLNRGEVNWLNN